MGESRDAVYKDLGYQQLTVSSVAVALTVPARARYARIRVENNSVRWRGDGVDPTAAVGMPLKPDDESFETSNPWTIRFIRVTSDAILNIEYFV